MNTADDRDETSVQDPVKSRTPCWTAIEPIIERPLLVESKGFRTTVGLVSNSGAPANTSAGTRLRTPINEYYTNSIRILAPLAPERLFPVSPLVILTTN